MKTKGLDFMEAVKVMEDGKKVRRPGNYYWHFKGNFLTTELNNKPMIRTEDVEATDWEVVDSYDDWNLADNSYDTRVYRKPIWELRNLEICRDLLTEDFSKKPKHSFAEIVKILAKRFGDLEKC